MARVTNAMITFNDARYMVTNEGYEYNHDSSLLPATNECMTKGDITSYLDVQLLGTYASNQLVPYNKIIRKISIDVNDPQAISYLAGFRGGNIYSYSGWSSSRTGTWISVSPTTGGIHTTTELTFTWSQNNSGIARTSTFTFDNGFETLELTFNQSTTPPPARTAISLGRHTTVAATACTNYTSFPREFWIPAGQTFATATGLYLSEAATSYVSAGYFSNGTGYRYWNGSPFTISITSCP